MTPSPRLETVAFDSLIVRLFDAIDESHMPWVLAAVDAIRERLGEDALEVVPSYTTVLVQLDIRRLSLGEARARLGEALASLSPRATEDGSLHEIPVWYDASVGPELELIAQRAGITADQVIERHCAHDYSVFALGFAPGYGFMGLVEDALATPRLKTPRQKVAAGSVGIADRQTAVYPAPSPGGWNLIGRTATRLFDREREGYTLFKPGDRVRFVAIDRATFEAQGGDTTPQPPAEESGA
ncbi:MULTISPECIES: 5-oxoprolinase subunit PxpB [unclassified Halomonas]|uniref:5-oxoprolinase subunit PxpB n=1 Tax=unclassified Halomonas TaxID=2609666 RepID=UPI000F5FE073|nr:MULTISPECIES: 5-oxoprolinase subunit PxpB [unclassified Halomonas]MCJ8285820.1 5-oxoprolinase subunit PxpB [Halomonas sp.]NQY70431.1 5-oxoprolinase subunit PxpB [Halomonas sp.]RQW71765.1 5-oxoprolinase subunit PxpB [Halomonas sp. YLB-10]